MKAFRLVRSTVASLGLASGCFTCGFAQTNIQFVTNITGNFGQLAIIDHYLFSAGSTTPPAPALHIFDISDPRLPADVGYPDPGGGLSGVLLSSPRAYVGVGGGFTMGVQLLNITNPAAPTLIGNLPGVVNDAMAVSGSTLFLLNSLGEPSPTISIYDVSNTSSPANIGVINGLQIGVGYLFTKGNLVFAVSYYGLYVYDVSNPAASTLVGSVPSAGAAGLRGADLSGDYIYVTSGTNGLWIADVSCPTNPVVVFHQVTFPVNLTGVTISGNYAYAGSGPWSGGEPSGAQVYDVSNPTNAFLVGQIASYGVASGYSLAVSKSYLYSESSTSMTIYSLGAPSPPVLSITSTSTNTLLLSWPTPTPACSVQENHDLTTTDWITLTNVPVVVGTKNQVTIQMLATTAFYRLVSQ